MKGDDEVYWLIIGFILVVWVIHDIIKGSVWSYRKIYRSDEPFLYWIFIIIWSTVALLVLLLGRY